jgi:hypothetical protein
MVCKWWLSAYFVTGALLALHIPCSHLVNLFNPAIAKLGMEVAAISKSCREPICLPPRCTICCAHPPGIFTSTGQQQGDKVCAEFAKSGVNLAAPVSHRLSVELSRRFLHSYLLNLLDQGIAERPYSHPSNLSIQSLPSAV